MSENPYIKRYDEMRAAWEHGVLVRADLERKLVNVHALGIDLAHALRLAVVTDFSPERDAALEKWDLYILDLARKKGLCVSPERSR